MLWEIETDPYLKRQSFSFLYPADLVFEWAENLSFIRMLALSRLVLWLFWNQKLEHMIKFARTNSSLESGILLHYLSIGFVGIVAVRAGAGDRGARDSEFRGGSRDR